MNQVAWPGGQPVPSGFWSDVKQVWKASTQVANLLTIVSLGIPAFIAKLASPLVTLWDMFVITAPLTLAVTIIGVALLRGWFKESGALGLFVGFPLTVAVAMVLTSWLGRLMDVPGRLDIDWWSVYRSGEHFILGIWFVIESFGSAYYHMYGTAAFLSSLVLGGFLAWVWGVKVLPRLDQLRRG